MNPITAFVLITYDCYMTVYDFFANLFKKAKKPQKVNLFKYGPTHNWYSWGIDQTDWVSPCGKMRYTEVHYSFDKLYKYNPSLPQFEIFHNGKWLPIQTHNSKQETYAIDGPWIPNFITWLKSVREKQDQNYKAYIDNEHQKHLSREEQQELLYRNARENWHTN